jgi:hypothetical protein
MNEPIQVSARALGQIAQPDVCARCLWIRSHCGDKAPYSVFPGIFSSIDKYSKGVTAAHFEKRGVIPTWFNELGDLGAPMSVPHWSRFRVYDDKTGITLSGMPDEMIRKKDGSVFIVDYKTARFTERADTLLPLYGVQLNVYGHIATKLEASRHFTPRRRNPRRAS